MTTPLALKKPLPVKVTVVPAGPEAGLNPLIVGAPPGAAAAGAGVEAEGMEPNDEAELVRLTVG